MHHRSFVKGRAKNLEGSLHYFQKLYFPILIRELFNEE